MAHGIDDIPQSVIEVSGLIFEPLAEAVYGINFTRGPVSTDGTSLFVGDNIWAPRIFSVVGEVREMRYDNNGPMVVLGRPSFCGLATYLFWRWQIAVLEKVESADFSVDRGLCIGWPHIERWICQCDGEDSLLMYLFLDDTVCKHCSSCDHF
ncbi:hypothetical protein L208DRAFT_1282811 [Tricholoma matsutake]|nr:hypothetical protein L208DRAFT_1282811 [Tricholoma matsutake 945]